MMRSSGFSAFTACTICSVDCRVMGLPQFGQCGVPMAL
jgi:hypothetical protein